MEAGQVNPGGLQLPPPALVPLVDLSVDVGPVIEVGSVEGPMGRGERRIIPIVGGTARCVHPSGAWQARVLDAGADFQLVVGGRIARLEARYVLETDAGDRIYVENLALRGGPPELIARLARGEPVDPAQVYFRCQPRFETASPALAWMMDRLFVGTGARFPDRVAISVFEVA